MWIAIAIIAVIVVLLIWIIGMYNGLVGLRNRYKNAYAQIDVQLKRRYDLIPNLVETAKGYMKHERETLEAVTAARGAAANAGQQAAANPGDPGAMKALMAAEAGLGGALGVPAVVMALSARVAGSRGCDADAAHLRGGGGGRDGGVQ